MSASARSTPQHAPALGLTHRLLGRFHVTGIFWYRFAYWGFTRPPSWTEWISVPTSAVFFFLVLGRIRAALASNLEPVLGPTNALNALARSFRTIWAFSWCFTERYRRLANPERFIGVLEGEEHWREVMDAPKGVILATAHIGPWETAIQFGASNAPRRVHIVREKEIDPRAQRFIEELVARSGDGYVTHFAGEDLTLAIELARALGNGDVVAVQCDRPRDGGRTLTVSLFGHPMPLPVGPAALARAAQVPILPVFHFREGRFRVRTVVRPPIHVPATLDRDGDVARATQRLASEVEWAIRLHPHQWFCFRQLWG
jgi:lauroyl/myristoyl acyltransferase